MHSVHNMAQPLHHEDPWHLVISLVPASALPHAQAPRLLQLPAEDSKLAPSLCLLSACAELPGPELAGPVCRRPHDRDHPLPRLVAVPPLCPSLPAILEPSRSCMSKLGLFLINGLDSLPPGFSPQPLSSEDLSSSARSSTVPTICPPWIGPVQLHLLAPRDGGHHQA